MNKYINTLCIYLPFEFDSAHYPFALITKSEKKTIENNDISISLLLCIINKTQHCSCKGLRMLIKSNGIPFAR